MTATTRVYSSLDRLLLEIDRIIAPRPGQQAAASRPSPAAGVPEPMLDGAARRQSAALMRVNHSGEVSAQALYRGQGLLARERRVRAAMETAAREETDHLLWCEQRIRELGGRTSLLNPVWYTGSFLIGAGASAFGDRWSLGFLAETERQVVAHLTSHLASLPAADTRSRAVLEVMREDEGRHATVAVETGAAELPAAVRCLMRCASRIMTSTAYYV